MKYLKNYKFSIILIISITLGCLSGVYFKDFSSSISPLGDLFLNMLCTVVVPLVFFTISSSIANMKSIKKINKILRKMFLIFIVTSLIASIFMLLAIYIYNPVEGSNIKLVEGTKESVNVFSSIVSAISVNDFSEILSKNHMLPLIIFTICFGLAVNLTEKEDKRISSFLKKMSDVFMRIVKWIMYYAPIGLFSYFAVLVSTYGPEIIGSYAKSLIMYFIVCVLYFLIFYTIYAFISDGKNGVKKFYRYILEPILVSFGTQSSLATLPTNMKAAEEIGISEDVRNVTLPVGATIHMEGSSMAAILKIFFLLSIFGTGFDSFGSIIIALTVAVLSGVVMSGIPGGGLLGEMLIISLYNFPITAFPIIATIGWIVDPPATSINVCGDTASAMLIDKYIKS
ncbi:MAG: dicarboxylate/amino acid:cation symporter [Bacilli bacterium]|nr:dicarboxylate/amino acid:cation symporter [Bacilli bacterium]